jgi:hypothetical protein
MIPLMTEIRQLLALSHLNDPFRASLKEFIESSITTKMPYLSSMENLPLMSKTCFTLEWLDGDSDKDRVMIEWILRCESPSGGFGAAPGLTADINHTCRALHALKVQGISPKYPQEVHKKWIICSLFQLLHGQELKDVTDWLEQTRLAVEALSNLPKGKMQENLKKMIAQKSIRMWKNSSQSIQNTRNFLQILDYIETQDHSIHSFVRNDWLPAHENSLPLMKPDTGLPHIIDLLWILRLLFPGVYQYRQSVSQAIDNLSKVYYRYRETVN